MRAARLLPLPLLLSLCHVVRCLTDSTGKPAAVASPANDELTVSCTPNERTAFTLRRHSGEGAFGSASVVVPQQSLAACARLCVDGHDSAGRPFACAAFDYVAAKRSCMMSGPHFGGASSNAVAPQSAVGLLQQLLGIDIEPRTPTKRPLSIDGGDNGDTGFYRKICLPASAADRMGADEVVAFDEVAERVLPGATDELVKTASLSECLTACAAGRHAFLCRSAMFYYETGDCLLNAVDRSRATAALSDQTDGFRVDYFENRLVAGGCAAGSLLQYVITTRRSMPTHTDAVVKLVSRAACEHMCTVDRAETGAALDCRAYAYSALTQTCYLLSRRQSTTVEKDFASSVNYYEKLCLAAPSTCVKSPAFERVSNHVLVGFSEIILEQVASEERCLSECMQAHETMSFGCLSAMFYSEAAECVLNTDTRLSTQTADFFSNSTETAPVDYFDNLCTLRFRDNAENFNTCPLKTQSTYVEFEATELAGFDSETYSDVTLDECLKKCEHSVLFTCRSADYRPEDATCTLSFQDSRVAKSALEDVGGTNFYERHCVEGAQFICGAMGVSFTAVRQSRLLDSVDVELSGVSQDECLALCMQDPSHNCRSVNYEAARSLCQLNNATKNSQIIEVSTSSVYLENRCFGATQAQRSVVLSRNVAGERLAQLDVEPTIETDCQFGGMRVRLTTSRPFTGYVFAKNRFETCRTDIDDATNANLELSFPRPVAAGPHGGGGGGGYGSAVTPGDCGVVETGRSQYSAVIIVAMNMVGIPGLVTQDDRFFQVSCDYSASLRNKVEATGAPFGVSDNDAYVAELQPDGRIFIPPPLAISLQRGGQPASAVVLGEQLELAFDYVPAFNRDLMGAFVRQCNASRPYGMPPTPAPLVMIDDGCPMAAVQGSIINGAIAEVPQGYRVPFTVFKFDGGPSVKISCAIDLCEGACNPTTCLLDGGVQQSFGRKKRAVLVNNATTSGRRIRSEMKSFIFTVVDERPSAAKKHAAKLDSAVSLRNAVRLQNLQRKRIDDEAETGRRGQLCVRRFVFTAIFSLVCLVCLCELVAIFVYFLRQWSTIRLAVSKKTT